MSNSNQLIACPQCGQHYTIDPAIVKEDFSCTGCQSVVSISGADQPGASVPAVPPVVPPVSEAVAPQQPPQSTPQPTLRKSHRSSSRSCLPTLLAIGLTFAGIALIAGFAFFLHGKLNERAAALKEQVAEAARKQKEAPSTETQRAAINWAIAGAAAVKLDHMRVQIQKVEYGQIRAKDAGNNIRTSGDEELLLKVYLDIRNRGLETEYNSWYGEPANDTDPLPHLIDRSNRQFEMMLFDDAMGIQGHVPRTTIGQKESIQDVILFALPESVQFENIEDLYLSLPGTALGLNGMVHFKIPAKMIQHEAEAASNGLEVSPLVD